MPEKDSLYDLWMLLGRTHHVIARTRDRELDQWGISREVAFLLFVINALGENATPNNIWQHTVLQTSTVSEMLDRMVKTGLIEKLKQTDGKSRIRVKLTDEGNAVYKHSIERESIHKAMRALSKDQRKQLQSCLTVLLETSVAELSAGQRQKALDIPPSRI
jgi:DNA-binding MarR family transcriptional regulator